MNENGDKPKDHINMATKEWPRKVKSNSVQFKQKQKIIVIRYQRKREKDRRNRLTLSKLRLLMVNPNKRRAV